MSSPCSPQLTNTLSQHQGLSTIKQYFSVCAAEVSTQPNNKKAKKKIFLIYGRPNILQSNSMHKIKASYISMYNMNICIYTNMCKFAFKILHRKSSKGHTQVSLGRGWLFIREELVMQSKLFIFSYFCFSVFSKVSTIKIYFLKELAS